MLNRRDRYSKMFSGLGNSVRGKNHRVYFDQAILWSLEFLKKDDRIVWYLSIIQRFAFLKLLEKRNSISRKLSNKMSRKLRGFKKSRILDDFDSFQESKWEHFASVQAVYSHPSMLDYRFYDDCEEGLQPKSASTIFGDFSSLEQKLQEKGGGARFCNDGEILLDFKDGWAWFLIKAGFSRQEAMAMRHCGNGDGNSGDELFSLREPISKPHGVCWKPHLTFILRKGYLGEMKGFANQKPDPYYHTYIEELLKIDGIDGITGGGYLPQNNFEFLDLKESSKIEILEKKPDFDFDLIGNEGKSIIKFGTRAKWKHFIRANCPEQAMSHLSLKERKEPEWLAFQSPFATSRKEYENTLAFCAYDRGSVSKLHILNEWVDSVSLAKILHHPMLSVIKESLLVPESTWDKITSQQELESLMKQKPGLFRGTSLGLIYENFGCCDGFVEVINDQLNLNLKNLSDGVELLSFSSLQSFARRTGIGSLIRKSKNLINLPNHYCSDLFQLGWLTFRKRKCPFSPIYLHLEKESVMYLFASLDLSGSVTPKELMRELVYRFGPPNIFQSPRLLVA